MIEPKSHHPQRDSGSFLFNIHINPAESLRADAAQAVSALIISGDEIYIILSQQTFRNAPPLRRLWRVALSHKRINL